MRRNKHRQPYAAVDTQALTAQPGLQPGARVLSVMGSDALWGQVPIYPESKKPVSCTSLTSLCPASWEHSWGAAVKYGFA